MIRDRIRSAGIRAISYDSTGLVLSVEFSTGSTTHYSPVSYDVYHTIISSRFPEKIYRHFIKEHIL
jgi:hypothetical protein